MQEIQVNCPYEWQWDCADVTDVILTILLPLRAQFAHLSRPVVNYRIQNQQFVHLDEETVENHVAPKEEIAPFDRVLVTEFVKDKYGGSDALPGDHGQELIQELVPDCLGEHD